MNTWDANKCLKKVDLVKRADSGADPDIFDSFFGFGGLGDPFLADITEAGWLPRAFFEAVRGPGGGRGILAFSVTFIFEDDDGNPTDINGDNRLDGSDESGVRRHQHFSGCGGQSGYVRRVGFLAEIGFAPGNAAATCKAPRGALHHCVSRTRAVDVVTPR
jgi:hypothetical protein